MSNLNSNTTQLESLLAKVNALPEAGENDTITIVTEGTGEGAVQQIPRADKVTIADGETTPHFDFTGHDDANMAGRIEYGAVGNNSASFNGQSAALNKHAFAINNSTIAKGEESFAQGYETIAEGNSSVATGRRTWAKGLASHTEGFLTEANGNYSHASGFGTKANGDAQTVVGMYNADDPNAKFIVGAGYSESPANAFTAGNDGTNKYITVGDSKFTETDLNNMKNQSGGGGSTGPVEWTSIQNKPNIHIANGGGVKIGETPYPQVVDTSTTSLIVGGYDSYTGAPGAQSIAFGECDYADAEAGTIAYGKNSIAGGLAVIAKYDQSQAFGYAVQTGQTEQMVIGKYNKIDEDAYFVIGAGDTSQLDWYNSARPGSRNCFTVGNDSTGDYFTLGSTKITSNDLNKIEQHAAMINCITSATKNGSITLTPLGNTKYQGTFTLTVEGIVTGCVNHDSIGNITVKNTGTVSTIKVSILKQASSNPLDDTVGSYNFTYYYIPIST